MSAFVHAVVLSLVLGQGSAATPWTDVAPPGAGFSVQAPGTAKPNPAKPSHFEYVVGDSAFMVDADAMDDSVPDAVVKGDAAAAATYLQALRESIEKRLQATERSSSSADFNGHPSIVFSFTGQVTNRPFEARQRIVVGSHLYSVLAIGFTGEISAADVDRFFSSFRLTGGAAAAPAGAVVKTVAFTDVVCGRIPPVAITFQMPSDFVSRAVPASSEAGCLWGIAADLDRVTADPSQGDFSVLERGVFRARLSTNVACNPATGVFDALDGLGEAGIRRTLESTARVVVWKKESLGGLPALQIVADAGGRRAYMLYLGGTSYISNAMLVNFYRPRVESAADDELWSRFVAGIRAR